MKYIQIFLSWRHTDVSLMNEILGSPLLMVVPMRLILGLIAIYENNTGRGIKVWDVTQVTWKETNGN